MMGGRTRLVMGVLILAAAVGGLLAATGTAQAQEEERLITLDLRDATLDDALRLIFRSTPYSYVLAPGVTGRVTLTLNNVTFTQALRAILEMQKLTYRREQGNVYYVMPKPETTTPEVQPGGERPAPRRKIFWFGPGGRYELQYLDVRQVTTWFGGWEAGPQVIPVPVTGGGAGGGGMGGGRGGGGGGAAGGGGRGGGGGGAAGGGGGRGGGGGGGSGGGRGGGGGSGGGGGRGGGGGSGGGGSGGGGSGGGRGGGGRGGR